MSAYEEGREAFNRDDCTWHNPYDDNDAQYDDWLRGWLDAKDEYYS